MFLKLIKCFFLTTEKSCIFELIGAEAFSDFNLFVLAGKYIDMTGATSLRRR